MTRIGRAIALASTFILITEIAVARTPKVSPLSKSGVKVVYLDIGGLQNTAPVAFFSVDPHRVEKARHGRPFSVDNVVITFYAADTLTKFEVCPSIARGDPNPALDVGEIKGCQKCKAAGATDTAAYEAGLHTCTVAVSDVLQRNSDLKLGEYLALWVAVNGGGTVVPKGHTSAIVFIPVRSGVVRRTSP